MHHKLINTRTLSLLATAGIFCLLTGSAHAQRSSGRRTSSNRAATAATTSGTSANATIGTSTTGSASSGTSASCPGMTSSSSTGTTGTTSTGTTTSVISPTKSVSAASTAATAQSTLLAASTVSATRTASQLAVQYTGTTSGVKAVYVAVLDSNQRVLQQQAITQNPVQASLSLGSTARYYGVQVVYTNGATKTLISTIK